MSQAFHLRRDDNILTLTFDLEGEKVNKLSSPVLAELDEILSDIHHQNNTEAMIITSHKPGIFIAGADINEIKALSDPNITKQLLNTAHTILGKLEQLPFPTIAAIDGACLGGGLELALACTYRVASDHHKTQLGLPEVNLGIIPGFGGTQRLPRLIGLQQSLGLILPGKQIDGKKALKLGLVDACVSHDFFHAQVQEFVRGISTLKGRKRILDKRKQKGLLNWALEKTALGRQLVFSQAKKGVLKQTKGQYPAPLAALKAVQHGHGKRLDKALIVEAQCFGEVCHGDISKHLIHLFFLNEQLKKDAGFTPQAGVEPLPVRQAGVLGAGLMGGGIAWALSYRGIPVRMKDIHWDSIAKGFEAAKKIYTQLVKKRRLKEHEATNALHRISGTLDYSGFEHTDVVIEAILENMDLKKTVFQELEDKVAKHTVIASNTSALSITDMASVLKRPENFVGMHFFSPVNRMPLVEVIPGEKSSDQSIATIVQLARTMKKTPIVVQNCAGFLVNRILLPYVNEAVLCLEDGDTIHHVDQVAEAFGMPLGPLALGDEVGLDVGIKVSFTLEEAYGSRMKVAASFHDVYADETLRGKKTGAGFYVHTGKEKTVNPALQAIVKKHHRHNNAFKPQDTLDRLILVMVNEAARCLEEGVVASAAHLDMGMIMGTGFPPFRGGLLRYADSEGIPTIVDRLNELAQRYGDRFKPAQLLLDYKEKGTHFF